MSIKTIAKGDPPSAPPKAEGGAESFELQLNNNLFRFILFPPVVTLFHNTVF